ncbi:MAG: hypothetical protein HQL54_13735 [Magnetococcales bacterium]|nr:hypothetical protein [Magnetococcales bacterium]
MSNTASAQTVKNDRTWHVPYWDRFLREPLEGEKTALLHPMTGHTHFLNALVMDILQELAEQPATLDTLFNRLGVSDASDEERMAVERIIIWMDQEGLVAPLPS